MNMVIITTMTEYREEIGKIPASCDTCHAATEGCPSQIYGFVCGAFSHRGTDCQKARRDIINRKMAGITQ